MTPRGLVSLYGLKAVMIFGKKPGPRGSGDREGERGKEAKPGGSRVRRTF